MHDRRALHIDLATGFYRVERIADPAILGPVDFGFREWLDGRALCLGGGPFMGSILPGSNRLIFTGHSPCWDGFYVSTMGGAGLIFDNLGLDFLALHGRCRSPSILLLRREGQDEVEVEIHPVDLARCWQPEGEHEGLYALQAWIWRRFAGRYSHTPRILAVGPGALCTDMGAIASARPGRDGPGSVDCWAGRGGLGSGMAQGHGVLGVIYGGSFQDEDMADRKLADAWFERRYQVRMLVKDLQATQKYRYDPELATGGTLGVNYCKLGDRGLAFNYRSVRWPKERRLATHQRLVLGHYLAQFNAETIRPKAFSTCGEPCPAVCKKLFGRYKKDYEPYQALGPGCGIFDQRAAERLVGRCDTLGFDSIQVGGLLSWLLDLLDEGLLDPAAVGAPGRPVFSDEGFRVVEDSDHNATVALALVEAVAEGRLDLSGGAIPLAQALGAPTGRTAALLDRLVVTRHSETGWMVPNQYWTPGVFAPMPVMGKYYQHYGDDFVPPRALGRRNAERMIQEIFLDNMGFCRFHRGWAEELLPSALAEAWGWDQDLGAHHLALARRLHARNQGAFHAPARVVELLHGFVRRKVEEGAGEEARAWLDRFEADPVAAARDFWYEQRRGADEVLGGGA